MRKTPYVTPNYLGRSIGPLWTGAGHPAPITVAIPNQLNLVGLSVFAQRLLFAPGSSGVRIGLTTGIEIRVGWG